MLSVKEEAHRRQRICMECPEMGSTIGAKFCKVCKCLLRPKSYIEDAKCPLGKWEVNVNVE